MLQTIVSDVVIGLGSAEQGSDLVRATMSHDPVGMAMTHAAPLCSFTRTGLTRAPV